MQPFIRSTPHTEQGRFYDQGLMDIATQQTMDAHAKIARDDAATKQDRISQGWLAADDWYLDIDKGRNYGGQSPYAEGGIASLNVKK